MSHRRNLNSLTSAERTQLVSLMLQYITDTVVADHMNIVHSGEQIFIGHRRYVEGMENFLRNNGGGQFVPLPLWNPENPIPPEFNVVKAQDNGSQRPALRNLNPGMSLPQQFRTPAVCNFTTGGELGDAINGWHGQVHNAVGGTMADIMTSPAAPIFWCWHAFVDHIYWDWQQCSGGNAGGSSSGNTGAAGGNTSNQGGFCFIATATMGNYQHPSVVILSQFRDEFLLTKIWGKKFVQNYYRYSPPLAKIIEKKNWLKTLSYHIIVQPLVTIVKLFFRQK